MVFRGNGGGSVVSNRVKGGAPIKHWLLTRGISRILQRLVEGSNKIKLHFHRRLKYGAKGSRRSHITHKAVNPKLHSRRTKVNVRTMRGERTEIRSNTTQSIPSCIKEPKVKRCCAFISLNAYKSGTKENKEWTNCMYVRRRALIFKLTTLIEVTAEGEAAGVWQVLTGLHRLGPTALRAWGEKPFGQYATDKGEFNTEA